MDEETDMARDTQRAAQPAGHDKEPASYDSDFYTWSQEQGRLVLDDVLTDNPGLQPCVTEAMTRAYRKARPEAVNETGLKKSAFSESCPYTFEDVTKRPFPDE
jgi:hypothetical protein